MGKKKNKQQEWQGEEIEETEEDKTVSEEETFDPEKHGIKGLDEFAMQLQVQPTSEPEKGIVLWSTSGRVYSWVDLLSAHLMWSTQAVFHVSGMLEQLRGEVKNELNKRPRQPAQTNNTNRDT